MPSRKKVVCRCIDVTEFELNEAIQKGRTDIESLKRKTGIGTGPCQGKSCVPHVLSMLAKSTGKSQDDLGTMRPRPPVQSIELGVLAKSPVIAGKRKREDGR